jgi:pimeloyl-ACP methyl ester carboxylesterase
VKRLSPVVMSLSLFLVGAPAGVSAKDDVEVQRAEFPVTLSDGHTYTMAGYLYSPHGNPGRTARCGKRRHTVQVLVHGATYTHRYWDAAIEGETGYSYARFMAGRCYSVLALDRLGAGESSDPDGDLVNLANDASSLAQVVRSLREPENPMGRKFKNVVLVGHSFGTFASVYAQGAEGNPADALVATGWLHSPGTIPVDPAVIAALLGSPYIGLPPEFRTALFYHAPSAEPAVVDYDNATLADTFTRGFLLDAVQMFTARALGDVAHIKAISKVDQVTVPVFVQLGDFDALFPSALAGPEAGFYSSSPSVTVDHLTDMGHSFNLHRNRQEGWEHIADWIADTVVSR